MTTKADYTDQEWQVVTITPPAVALATFLAEQSRPRQHKRKMTALQAGSAKAAAEFPNNQLVQAALADVQSSCTSAEIVEYSKSQSYTDVLAYAVDQSKQLAAILAQKSTPAEADEYKAFALLIGKEVADAVADAEWFGIGGETMSRNERKALYTLADALSYEI